MSDDHGPVWYDSAASTWVYRASALALCTRALVASRRGMPRPPLSETSLAAANEGTYVHETDILERLLPERGWVGLGEQQREVEVEVGLPGVVVRGHIDEIVEHTETRMQCVVDAKSMSRAVFLRWAHSDDSKPGYLWQISAYMHALGLPGLIAAKNRDNGELLLRFYETAPVSLSAICERVLRAHREVDSTRYPACDVENRWFCDYSYLHDGYANQDDEPVAVEDIGLDEVVQGYQAKKSESEVLQAELAELREDILFLLGDIDRVRTLHFDITRRPQERSWLSNAKVKRLLTPEQLEKATERSSSDYLIVKKREDPR